jgi:hypothetical protein
MLNITEFSTVCVNLDRYLDYVPVLSTITNLIDIFLKYVVQPRMDETDLQTNHYLTYLDTKKLSRCLILTIPLFGNIIIAVLDIYGAFQAEQLEEDATLLYSLGGLDKLRAVGLFLNAADNYSSSESYYWYGIHLLHHVTNIDTLNRGKKYLRMSASLGHSMATNKLRELQCDNSNNVVV